MGNVPPSQVLASWVKEALVVKQWVSVRELLTSVIEIKLSGMSATQRSDIVETNVSYVIEHLRDEMAEWRIDGAAPRFEIDQELTPYIQGLGVMSQPLLRHLRSIYPADFEKVCARILKQLGGDNSVATPATNDGGIDFYATEINIVPGSLSVPLGCKAAIIGQSKRYKDGALIRETQLREFVGACVLRHHELCTTSKIMPLSPVIRAFWTTSDFDPNARLFARRLGLWHMEGITLAEYVRHLNLEQEVMNLPLDPSRAQPH